MRNPEGVSHGECMYPRTSTRFPTAGTPNAVTSVRPVVRVQVLYGLFLALVALFGLRLFYVQIIHYEYYKNAALSDQLKQYEIPAARGIIKAHDGNGVIPIVLNQELYTLYADPVYVKHADETADKIASI